MSERFSLAAGPVASPFAPPSPRRTSRRRRGPSRPLILAVVSVFHLGLIWVAQAEFRHPRIDVVEPDVVMAELVELPPAAPKAAPEPKPAPPKPAPIRAKVHPTPAPMEAPFTLAAAPTPPAAQAAAAAPSPEAAPARSAPAAEVRPPSADADYAACRVAYPPLSRSLREHGRVTLNVLVSGDGRAKRVELMRSSGSPRLDRAAREAMRRCHFHPGTVNGAPKEMTYEAPVDFVLR
jgi:protein TonB